jgi:hemoglobin-like flavoprotein
VTPEQVALVQGSFADLGPRTGDLAARFYRLLFEADPSLRSMFSADPRVQESVFASELAVVVRSILRFDEFVARARELGARHVGYGVTYAHYEIAGGVLLVALEETLGPAFTQEVRDAWRHGFHLVAETMMQGAAEVTV